MLAAGAAASASLTVQAREADPAIVDLPPWTTTPGSPVAARPYGQPSRHQSTLERRELPGLSPVGGNSASFCPLQGLFGIITPSGLHYERHHHGWHDIDPARQRLMINAADPRLIDKPKIYTLDELMRLPPVSRIHFIECGGNTGTERERATAPTVQYTHGLVSCSEFTGVPLRRLLEDCGVDFRRARFVLAEGADGASLTRTIPMELIESGEVLVAYGQNGEMLRPENGFPLRLVVPGVQGISWVKWLRRIEVGDAPYATREESLQYIDLMPDGLHRQYTSLQECKSVITTPSGGQTLLTAGFYNVSGLAWSGRGRVERVDVSVDGGRNWERARLETPVLSKALTRFNFDWVWEGKEAVLQSRAIDETGHVQPTYTQLRAARGTGSIYHNNAIQSWQVRESGEVVNVQVL
jgi:sulfane dehydrogenase subunit SoxC